MLVFRSTCVSNYSSSCQHREKVGFTFVAQIRFFSGVDFLQKENVARCSDIKTCVHAQGKLSNFSKFFVCVRPTISGFPCQSIASRYKRRSHEKEFLVKNIRIFNGCEVLIKNSVTRVTVRHHEACRVMPNSYPSDGIFNLHRRTIMDSVSCILFLRQLHLDGNGRENDVKTSKMTSQRQNRHTDVMHESRFIPHM